MKTLKLFLCSGIQQAVSIATVILFIASGCARTHESPEYIVSETTTDLPAHATTNWGVLAVSDTLLCYAIESVDSSDLFQTYFYQSTNEGMDWSYLGKLELSSNPAFPYFHYCDGKALFAYDDYIEDMSSIYHAVFASTDGCRSWSMIKEGAGKLQGACLLNGEQISLLQVDSLQYTVTCSNDLGQHWTHAQKGTLLNSSSQIVLNDDAVIYSVDGTVVRTPIHSDNRDTLFISNSAYGIDDLISNKTLIGFSDNCRKSAILKNGETVPFSPEGWKSSYRIPTFISDQGEMIFVSIRNLSMIKPKCKTYVIRSNGWEYIELCDGRIDCACGNKAYLISHDNQKAQLRVYCCHIK